MKLNINDFTPRQIEVLKLLCKGLTAKEVALALNIAEKTVTAHSYQMRRISGFGNTRKLVAAYMKTK